MSDANTKPSSLIESIVAVFNLEELKTLCFELNINHEHLSGDTLPGKVRELLQYLDRQGRTAELLPQLQTLRPHIPWHTFQPAEPEAEAPFKGLHYFDESDAHLFFGREQLTAELLDHLRQHRFLAVVGASGSGKSSLVRAGVIPAIRRGEIKQNSTSSATWPIHLITPGDEPLKALAATLTQDSESVTALKALLADLRADAESLDLFLYRQINGQPEGRVLLVVDQFEELFTQCDDPEERRLFVGNLVCAVQSGKQGRLSLILTLRADFYAHAVQYEALRPLLETRQKIVGAMNRDELRRAIEAPAARDKWRFQPGLVETMLQDVGREPGALPLLSHALQETWTRREGRVMTLAGYHAAGGVRRAIAQTADTVYASLTPPQQTIARNIFLRLTELGEGTEDTRRRATLTELLPQDDTTAEVQAILDLLTRKRLLTLNEERAGEGQTHNYAEVAHEALIREWPALRQWLDENREGLRLHRQLTDAAQAWHTANEDPGYLYRGGRLEQIREWINKNPTAINVRESRFLAVSQQAVEHEELRRQKELEIARKIRRATWGLITLFVIAVGAAFVAFAQSSVARENLAIATIAQGEAQINLTVAVAEGNSRATQEAIAFESVALAATREAEAITQARIAQSQALAASSQTVSEHDPMEALLLAIAAGQTAETSLAMDVLNQQLPIMAKTVQIMSHEGLVIGTQWNGNASHILVWSEDGIARVWDAITGESLVTLSHEDSVTGAVWNEDESRILTWSEDGTARIWDAITGEQLLSLRHDRSITGAIWKGDESRILTWSFDHTARLWDATTGELLLTLNHGDWVYHAVWNEDESHILTWSRNGSVHVWDTGSGEQLLALRHDLSVTGAIWNRDESIILTWSEDGTVKVWDATTGEPLVSLIHEDLVTGAVWNGDESHILTWSEDGTARVWDAITGEPLLTLSHEGSITGAVWSGDESHILTWSEDGTARVWDVITGEPLLTLSHEGSITGAVWSGDESHILTWSEDGTARIWDATPSEQLLTLSHEARVYDAVWNGDESRILTYSDDGTAKVWDATTGEPLLTLSHEAGVYGAVWNRDESRILTWACEETERTDVFINCIQGIAKLWDTTTGDPLLTLYHEVQIIGAMWNGDESRILTWGCEANGEFYDCVKGTVKIWNTTIGEPLLTLSHEAGVEGARWNRDESRILTWSFDGTAKVWDATTGEPLLTLSHEAGVDGAEWNRDESRVLTWGFDGTAKVWDATTGEPLLILSHENRVSHAVWNRDESRILTFACEETERIDVSFIHCVQGIAKIWNATTGEPLLTLSHESSINNAQWNGDESRVAVTGNNGTVRIWDATTGELLLTLSHGDLVYNTRWNENESHILTWGSTAKLWDAATGELLFTLRSDGDPVAGAHWNQDESRILLVSFNNFIRVYYTHTVELAEHACEYATRNFTWQEWQLYFPGQPYQQTCPHLPVHPSVPQTALP